MRPYEVMVIFDAGTEPPLIQATIDRVLETVRANGGTPGTVDRWGRRPFAYEVKHRREGYYVLIEFGGEVETVDHLDRMLHLADEVLRHRVIRLPEHAVKRSKATAESEGRSSSGPPRDRGRGGRGRGPQGSSRSSEHRSESRPPRASESQSQAEPAPEPTPAPAASAETTEAPVG